MTVSNPSTAFELRTSQVLSSDHDHHHPPPLPPPHPEHFRRVSAVWDEGGAELGALLLNLNDGNLGGRRGAREDRKARTPDLKD